MDFVAPLSKLTLKHVDAIRSQLAFTIREEQDRLDHATVSNTRRSGSNAAVVHSRMCLLSFDILSTLLGRYPVEMRTTMVQYASLQSERRKHAGIEGSQCIPLCLTSVNCVPIVLELRRMLQDSVTEWHLDAAPMSATTQPKTRHRGSVKPVVAPASHLSMEYIPAKKTALRARLRVTRRSELEAGSGKGQAGRRPSYEPPASIIPAQSSMSIRVAALHEGLQEQIGLGAQRELVRTVETPLASVAEQPSEELSPDTRGSRSFVRELSDSR